LRRDTSADAGEDGSSGSPAKLQKASSTPARVSDVKEIISMIHATRAHDKPNGEHAHGQALPLLPRHLADLRASGLTDETLRSAGVYTETDPGEVARLLNQPAVWAAARGPCLVLPYPAADGSPTGYARL
jgi:hypothetical protein